MSNPTTIFKRWVQRDAYGEDFTYHIGDGRERNAALFEYAAKLSDGGLVLLWQRRNAAGDFDHVARRISASTASAIDKISASVEVRRAKPRAERIPPSRYGVPAPGRALCLDYEGD